MMIGDWAIRAYCGGRGAVQEGPIPRTGSPARPRRLISQASLPEGRFSLTEPGFIVTFEGGEIGRDRGPWGTGDAAIQSRERFE
jgi:hypothetical protein